MRPESDDGLYLFNVEEVEMDYLAPAEYAYLWMSAVVMSDFTTFFVIEGNNLVKYEIEY